MTSHNPSVVTRRAPKRSRMETDPLALAVGAQIRALRIQRGLSGKALAAQLGVPGTQITAWERGRVVPSARSLLLLSRALGCEPAVFFPAQTPDPEVLAARVQRLPPGALPDLARFLAILERAHGIG